MSLKMFSMIMNYILLHLRCKLLWHTICNLDLVSYVLGHKGFTGSTLKSQGLWRSLRTLVTSGDVKMWKSNPKGILPSCPAPKEHWLWHCWEIGKKQHRSVQPSMESRKVSSWSARNTSENGKGNTEQNS